MTHFRVRAADNCPDGTDGTIHSRAAPVVGLQSLDDFDAEIIGDDLSTATEKWRVVDHGVVYGEPMADEKSGRVIGTLFNRKRGVLAMC